MRGDSVKRKTKTKTNNTDTVFSNWGIWRDSYGGDQIKTNKRKRKNVVSDQWFPF